MEGGREGELREGREGRGARGGREGGREGKLREWRLVVGWVSGCVRVLVCLYFSQQSGSFGLKQGSAH